ncbi:MAG: c-type cytochrome biogenesis protein CcsB, partial [Deltaproteobacteria bacterium]|nr:c-type cytochrome biogenesis protein CcsB [Deltaproteobacteria bacterium]
MLSSKILAAVTFSYLAAVIFYLIALIFKTKIGQRIGSIVTIGAFVAHTAAIILRWVESYKLGIGHAPFANFYESLVFFAWAIILVHFIAEYKYKIAHVGAFTVPFAFLSLAYASFSPGISSR